MLQGQAADSPTLVTQPSAVGVRTAAAEDQAGAADLDAAGTEAELQCACAHASVEATAQAEEAADVAAAASADAVVDATRKKAASKRAKKQRQKAKKQQAQPQKQQPQKQQMHQAQMQQSSQAVQEQSATLQDITSAINTSLGPHSKPEPRPSMASGPSTPAAATHVCATPAERHLPATLLDPETDMPLLSPKLPGLASQRRRSAFFLLTSSCRCPGSLKHQKLSATPHTADR